MENVAMGVFSNRGEAEKAISQLERRGYYPKDMSIMMKDSSQAKELSDETGVEDIADGAVKGAGAGAVVGGIAGLLAATVIPGIGGFLIGGPIGAALGLTGAAATTASGVATGFVAGGLLGALTSTFGLTDEEAETYESRLREGGVLVALPTRPGDDQEVRNILQRNGADNIKLLDVMTTKRKSTVRKSDKSLGDRLANPVNVEKFLKNLDFPADKSELIDAAQRQGADDTVLDTLNKLPDMEYKSPTIISREIGKFE